MKLKTFTLTLGETINLGNYNNARYEVAGTIELSGGDDVAEIEELRAFLKAQAREARGKIKGESQ